MLKAILQNYKSSILLVIALAIGGFIGLTFPSIAKEVKPIGEIFLNLLFMTIVPLVGVSVMSSIAKMTDLRKLGKILLLVIIISLLMPLVASLTMIGLHEIYNPAKGIVVTFEQSFQGNAGGMNFVEMVTASDFIGLLSKKNILALIIMSIIGGIAIGQAGESGQKISSLLDAANDVIMKLISIIMKLAPLGLGCYFADTMASQDPKLVITFGSVIAMFFVTSLVYFIFASTFYSWIAGGLPAIKSFWKYMMEPAATSLGTCSSLASLPVTIRAAKKMGLNDDIVNVSLPLLANLNKGGVAMIATLKVLFIYQILGIPFDTQALLLTLMIAVISAIIVGGVPGGAFLGEIFIVTTLGLPLEAIPMLVILGAITDAPATMLNVVNDLNATQIIQRFCGNKKPAGKDTPPINQLATDV